jgi:hypothetical protein
VIVMPLVVLDDFLIRKGYGVYNIHDFINAMLQADNVQQGYGMLEDMHHDFNHDRFAGVEADAVKIAARQGIGGLTPQDIEIINQGESANPQAWHQAFQKAVNAGAPLINEAIQKTNEINKQKAMAEGQVHRDIPLAFQKDMGNFVAVQAWRQPVLGPKGQTFNAQGALVTQLVSALTGKPEAYARPYGVGLEAIRKEKYPQLKMPKASDEISPRILHGDTLYIRDHNVRNRFAMTVMGIRNKYPDAQPEQLTDLAMQALRALPEFNKFAGLKHGSGLNFGVHSQEQMGERVADANNQQADTYENLMNFVPPELRGHAMYNTTGNSAYHSPIPSRRQMKLYQEHYGWDEETSKRVHEAAYSGKYSHLKNSRLKLMAAKRDEMIQSGKIPDHIGDEALFPSGSGIQSPVDEKKPETDGSDGMFNFTGVGSVGGGMQMQTPEAPKTPIQQEVEKPPQYPIRPDPPAPPKNAHVVGAHPATVNPAPPPPPKATEVASAPPVSPQNRPAPPIPALNAYPSTPPAVQNTGRGFLDNLMTRLGYAYESLFPSFGKSDMSNEEMIHEMLENVQLEIAKKEVVQTIFTKSQQSISSVADVSMIANKMNRPNSDIVSVYHSRGDWENVAKTFGMTHKEVQTVKVMFNE